MLLKQIRNLVCRKMKFSRIFTRNVFKNGENPLRRRRVSRISFDLDRSMVIKGSYKFCHRSR